MKTRWKLILLIAVAIALPLSSTQQANASQDDVPSLQFGEGVGQIQPSGSRATPLDVPMQFDTPTQRQSVMPQISVDPNAPPGIAWLQKTPATLFDLGMMELTRTAIRTADGLFDVSGAVAVYHDTIGKISINFYAGTEYSPENCEYIARKMRVGMFPFYEETEKLAGVLSSYFIGFGPVQQGRPSSVGEELKDRLSLIVYLPGGVCELPIAGDRLVFMKDPSYVAPKLDPKTEREAPQIPDITNLLGKALKQVGEREQIPPQAGAQPPPGTAPAPKGDE